MLFCEGEQSMVSNVSSNSRPMAGSFVGDYGSFRETHPLLFTALGIGGFALAAASSAHFMPRIGNQMPLSLAVPLKLVGSILGGIAVMSGPMLLDKKIMDSFNMRREGVKDNQVKTEKSKLEKEQQSALETVKKMLLDIGRHGSLMEIELENAEKEKNNVIKAVNINNEEKAKKALSKTIKHESKANDEAGNMLLRVLEVEERLISADISPEKQPVKVKEILTTAQKRLKKSKFILLESWLEAIRTMKVIANAKTTIQKAKGLLEDAEKNSISEKKLGELEKELKELADKKYGKVKGQIGKLSGQIERLNTNQEETAVKKAKKEFSRLNSANQPNSDNQPSALDEINFEECVSNVKTKERLNSMLNNLRNLEQKIKDQVILEIRARQTKQVEELYKDEGQSNKNAFSSFVENVDKKANNFKSDADYFFSKQHFRFKKWLNPNGFKYN